jgi:putative DNA primase/helicase
VTSYEQKQDGRAEASGAERWPLPSSSSTDAAIALLAALSPVEYDLRRKDEAKRLGLRTGTLDTLVAAHREGGKPESVGGSSVVFPNLEPWPRPVEGGVLLADLADAFTRHLVLPEAAADALALWVLHAHAHYTAAISPILAITSPTPECGKTTCLTILGALVPRPLPASNITSAALFRAVEKWSPTVLVDEADTFLRDSDELRGVLNSGHNRGAAYVIRTVGDDHEPRQFKTWAPKAIALIGKPPDTLSSRAIPIELRRMALGETVEPIRADRLDHLAPLARMAARWASDNATVLLQMEPAMPPGLTGRRADNWRHLFALAEAAGDEWPERARRAAEALGASEAGETAAITLLADIRAIFEQRGADRISSEDLATTLGAMVDRPWSEWGKAGKPVTQRGIAKLLEPFKIKPDSIRIGPATPKGYLLEWFEDAFRRYLPDPSATPQHSHVFNDLAECRSATEAEPVADLIGPKSLEQQHCCGVADMRWEDTGDAYRFARDGEY